MEECNDNAAESTSNKQSLETTLKELAQTREEIRRARESAVQSWLDSIPTINELESSQSVLSRIKNNVTISNTAIASIRSLLDSTSRNIRKKQAEGSKSKMAIAEMHEEADRKREEMESLRVELKEKDMARNKIKEELQIKRQSLKTLHLNCRAINMEIEAVNQSVDASIHQAKHMKVDHEMVALSHEEYNALCKTDNDKIAAANSRIRLSEEKCRVAAMRKANALQQLEAIQREKHEMEKGMMPQGMPQEACRVSVNEDMEKPHLETYEKMTKAKASPMQRNIKEAEGYSQQSKRRARRQSNKKARKKQSILQRTRSFFVRKLRRLFK